MRTKSHWKHLLIGLFFVILVFMVTVGIASCKKNTDEDSSSVDEPIAGDEAGIYYFDADDAEYLISLKGNNFTLSISNETLYGEYTFDGTEFNLTFDGEGGGTASATLSGDVLTLNYNGSTYRFLKRVFYKVTYEVDGGSAIEASSVMNGKLLEKPADPKKDGYNFIGWYVDGDFSKSFDFNSQPITENLTIYARFEKAVPGQDEFEVKFVTGSEGETFENQKTIGGVVYDLPTPSKEGFLGWWISDFEDASKLTCKYEGQKLAQNTTLYAVYESDAPAVSVNAQGVSWTAKGTNNNYQVKITLPNGKEDETVPGSTGATTLAYDFASKDAGEYKIEVSLNGKTTTVYYKNKALARVSLFQVAEPSVLVFNAVENAEKYIITVDCGNKEHNHAEFDNGNSTNFNFANCEMQEGGITFTVRAMASGYMYSQSETFVYSRDLDEATGLAVDAEQEEVVWNKVENATSYVVEIISGEESYKIDVGNTTRYSLKEYKGELTIKVTPVAKGYNSPQAATVTYNKTSLATPGNIRVAEGKLIWDAVEGASSYNVRIGANTHQVAPGSEAEVEFALAAEHFSGALAEISVQAVGANDSETSLYSDPIVVSYNTMSDTLSYGNGEVSWKYVVGAARYGITVNGGSEKTVDAGANKAAVTLTQAGANEIVVYYYYDDAGNRSEEAKITVYAYSVTFDVRGGTAVETLYKAIGDPMTLPTSTQEGYDFGGWYNVPGGPKGNGAEYTDKVFGESGDIILYAYWEPKAYTVTFDCGGEGTVDQETFTVYYNRAYTLPIPKATGSRGFMGWYTQPQGQGMQYTDDKGVGLNLWNDAQDMKLYAYWEDVLSFHYDTSTKGYSVSQGKAIKSVTSVTIPSVYDGEKVTIIDGGAFKGCSNLVSINIPDTVERIELPVDGGGTGSPFEGCYNLQSVNIYSVEGNHERIYSSTDGVLMQNKLGEDGTVQGVTLAYFPYAKEGAYEIPEGVTELRINVFKSADITEITIPASVTSIEQNAFRSCTKLEKVIFAEVPEGEDAEDLTIADYAFQKCTSLTQIDFPARLKEIPINSFVDCSALSKINVEENGQYYSSKNGVLCDAAGKTILFCPKGVSGTFEIPVGIQSIGESAFEGCTKISKLIIPGHVTTIKTGAFKKCSGLVALTFEGEKIDPSLTIDQYAFYSCTGLTEITLPENLVFLGAHAFGDIKALTKVNVLCGGNAVLENGAFADDSNNCYIIELYLGAEVPSTVEITGVFGALNLEKVEVAEGNPNFESEDGVLFNKGKTTILYYPNAKKGNYIIPASVEKIGAAVFKGKPELTQITISKNISEIGSEAFSECPKLSVIIFEAGGTKPLIIGEEAFYDLPIKEIQLPERVTTIGKKAFNDCDYLTEFVIPEGVKEVGTDALNGCDRLRKVKISSTVETLGEYSPRIFLPFGGFSNCAALEEIIVDENNKNFASVDGILYGKKDGVISELYMAPRKKSGKVTIPSSVIKVHTSAFYENSGITEIVFEDSANSIEIDMVAFGYCVMLQRVTLPRGLTTIEWGLFMGCTSLEEVFIPNTVTKIRDRAFANCSDLTTVNFEEGGSEVLVFEDSEKVEFVIGKSPSGADIVQEWDVYGIFKGADSLENIELPERTTKIGDYTFSGVSSLHTVSLPSTLTTIGAYAFDYTGLKSLNLPDGLETIGDYAFRAPSVSDYKISTLSIPASVTAIGKGAFSNNTLLTQVTFAADSKLETIGDSAFSSCAALTEIEIPASVKTIGTSVFLSCSKLTEITFQSESNLASIGQLAFSKTALTSFSFPVSSAESIKLGAKLFSACKNLTYIYVSKSVISLANVFADCNSIQKIEIADDHESLSSDEELPIIYNKDKTGLQTIYNQLPTGVFTLPEGITFIDEGAFQNQVDVTEIVLPTTLKEIKKNAFANCTSLQRVRFTNNTSNLLTIGQYAFKSCEALEEFIVPGTVTKIDNYAFHDCKKLTSVTISPNEGINISLGTNLFYGCTGLTTVALSDKITALNNSMFFGCSALEEIYIPAGVTKLPDSLFYGCKALPTVILPTDLETIGKSVFSDCSKLTSISLPEKVTQIGSSAFANTGLTAIEIPKGVTKLDSSTFSGCASLASVTFFGKEVVDGILVGGGLNELGASVFSGCTSLSSIVLPDSLKKVGNKAFYNSGLTSILLPQLESLGTEVFSGCGALESAGLPSSLKEIPQKTFQNCTALTEVLFADNLEKLGNYAFSNTGITSIIIPESVTSLGTYLFDGCLNLSEVTLPSMLTAIPNYIFRDCTALKSITIPATVRTIGASAFENTGLTEVVIPEGVTQLGRVFNNCADLSNVVLPESLRTLDGTFDGCTSLVQIQLPSQLNTLKGKAFRNTGLTSITLPEGITAIGTTSSSYTFQDCADLSSITFLGEIVTIGYGAFSGCTSLTSFIIPETVETIGSYAFENSGITKINIPASVTKIFLMPFRGCTSLTEFEVDEGNSTYGRNANGALMEKDTNTLLCFPAGGSGVVEIEDGVIIEPGAFYGCDKITEIILPDSMTEIDGETFEAFTGLEKIAIPASVKSIGSSAFVGCSSLVEVVLNEGLETIGSSAFAETAIASITIPASVKSIGSNAFEDCSSLVEVVLAEGLETIGNYAFRRSVVKNIVIPSSVVSIGTNVFESAGLLSVDIRCAAATFGTKIFYNCSLLESVTLAEGITSIGNYMFSGCAALKAIQLPKDLAWIGEYAFQNSGLIEIEIPSNVVYLAKNPGTSLPTETTNSYAFEGCVDLKTIVFNEGLKLIGKGAFKGCTSLETVELPNSLEIIGSTVFSESGLKQITLPEGVTTIGVQAFMNCAQLESISISESVTVINTNAFTGCLSMKSIFIPKTAMLEGTIIFKGWTKDQTIYLEATEDEAAEWIDSGAWQKTWNEGCEAHIEYGYTNL